MISCLTLLRSRTISERPAALEDVVLQPPQLAAELAEHREAGVDASVEDLVQEEARPLAHDLEPDVLARADPLEERGQRQDLLVRQGDDVVGTDEDVELGRSGGGRSPCRSAGTA